MKSIADMAIVIPAYNPDEKLKMLVDDIMSAHFSRVIVVNDGSKEECASIFRELEDIDECVVLHHRVNQGKGQALKTAFAYFKDHYHDSLGLITIDSDGQHTLEDMKKVAAKLEGHPDSLVLGSRNFSEENIPLRSRFGNNLTKVVVKFASGINVSDTQTGLRGIPAVYVDDLLEVKGDRYEYEMNMLLECKKKNIKIEEVNIKTIYIEENKSSHFNPIKDSIKIYSVFLKFIVSSFASFGVDILLFTIFALMLKDTLPDSFIIVSTVLARVLSSFINFMINRNVVFQSSSSHTMIKYYALSIVQMGISALAVHYIYSAVSSGEVVIKVIVDSLLFLVSFVIQREWVFKNEVGRSELLNNE
ncbi:bifunctional glycosyltransferase family 2/GtrA family protein [Rossellomorea vietnamensis]|uniref:bifunctional glycosyltransferase family 2/GtrA family protein n=1 Tax=Rossellomorea vietnamensis TaxID=218284 RepID=UPI000555B5CC|nr:bifunctional glycosyltransferase family 2/GtrA family protein [Rossellomorea vietnamensis]